MNQKTYQVFSIVVPLDTNRLMLFKNTKRVYDSMPQKKEFIIPTRNLEKVSEYLLKHKLTKDVRLFPYKVEKGFNCSKALNIGVRKARYKHIIITSPEVKPTTDVLAQFSKSIDKNIICQVDDQDKEGNLNILVNKSFRSETPAMYFLALFQKKDIESINGWDEDFMEGYAYEDNDFGDRWVRAGLPFEVREDIKATHQYHPRAETISGGMSINNQKFTDNRDNGVIQPINGLNKIINVL